jgi:hypothetical protein
MATSTLGSGTLVLAGTTSGTTTVTATAVAGTTTLTLPAATDTLVGKATTDTLTNKTLTGAVMNGTLGATTPSTGAFTTLTSTSASSLATSSGSVGIGTASPPEKLSVSGAGMFTGQLGNLNANSFSIDVQSSPLTARLTAVGADGSTNLPMIFAVCTTTTYTERLRLNTSGAVILQGGTTTANGIGITFPATQSASSDANTLDDYEEGTFTPTLAFGGGSTGLTYSVNSGTYTKIGRLVTGRFIVGLSNKGSSTGDAVVGGLPFTVGSDLGSAVTELAVNFTSSPPTAGWPQDATTNLNLWAMGATGVTNTTNANFANNTRLDMWFQYFV